MVADKMKNRLPIKGFREGLLISIGAGSWEKASETLLEQIDDKSDFFKGAKIAIDVGEREVHASELGQLRDCLSERGVSLFAVLGKSAMTQAVSESLGFSTEKQILKQDRNGIGTALSGGEAAVLIRKTVRSGVSVKYPGHVIVDGDINPGGEVLAGGSVYVWGKIRGAVQAGIDGSKEAEICAMEINSKNIRIANIDNIDHYILDKIKKSPKRIYLKNSKLIITDWREMRNS